MNDKKNKASDKELIQLVESLPKRFVRHEYEFET